MSELTHGVTGPQRGRKMVAETPGLSGHGAFKPEGVFQILVQAFLRDGGAGAATGGHLQGVSQLPHGVDAISHRFPDIPVGDFVADADVHGFDPASTYSRLVININ